MRRRLLPSVVELQPKGFVVVSGLAGLLGPAAALGGFGLALCATPAHR